MTQAQLDALDAWEGRALFNERERAVLAFADARTRNVQVPDAVLAEVSAQFEPQQLIELTAKVAAMQHGFPVSGSVADPFTPRALSLGKSCSEPLDCDLPFFNGFTGGSQP